MRPAHKITLTIMTNRNDPPYRYKQKHPWAKGNYKNAEERRVENSLIEGRILEEERDGILDFVRPVLNYREPTRPIKPYWCELHHKYEQKRERVFCLMENQQTTNDLLLKQA